MKTNYHKGCQVTLKCGTSSNDLLFRVQKRIESEYEGADQIVKMGALPDKLEVTEVLVPNSHPLSRIGEVNQRGELIRPMAGQLILQHISEIIREEEVR